MTTKYHSFIINKSTSVSNDNNLGSITRPTKHFSKPSIHTFIAPDATHLTRALTPEHTAWLKASLPVIENKIL